MNRDIDLSTTLAERDGKLEALWADLEDVAFDEDADGRLRLVDPWLCFMAGTEREEIWRWFDQRHSKGVYYLLYGLDGVDRTGEICKMTYLNSLCFDCDTRSCALNHDGECRFSLVNGRKPKITEADGCTEGVFGF